MKKGKKLLCSMLVVVMIAGLFAALPEKTQAAAKATVTKSVHLYVKSLDDSAIKVSFADKDEHIENLKTDSKNLKAKIVYMSSYDGKREGGIGLYATKEGTYTVTFDIYDANDKKVSSHSVKVYANSDHAMKSLTFEGNSMLSNSLIITDKSKGKLSVTVNKGYTLKKIVIKTYDKNGVEKSKTVKNNSNITLGKYSYCYEYGDVYEEYYSLESSMMAPTYVYIYYTDKYTKESECVGYRICRPAE